MLRAWGARWLGAFEGTDRLSNGLLAADDQRIERSSENAMSTDVDDANRQFWNELCGTQLARSLGIRDAGPESLRRFDDWYLDYYPYLDDEIPFTTLAGRRVLEVGVGYGTVSGRLMEHGAELTVLDIASAPVAMVKHRARQLGVECRTVEGSILEAPFDDGEFDAVVAIGCYHHTGDVQRALDETHRVLTPRGRAYVMVYNAYSYRRWVFETRATLGLWLAEWRSVPGAPGGAEPERRRYDVDSAGAAAPHTDFSSVRAFRRMTRRWTKLEYRRRNAGAEGPLRRLERRTAIGLLGPLLGLDLYFRLTR